MLAENWLVGVPSRSVSFGLQRRGEGFGLGVDVALAGFVEDRARERRDHHVGWLFHGIVS
jgi:hypothetical protein